MVLASGYWGRLAATEENISSYKWDSVSVTYHLSSCLSTIHQPPEAVPKLTLSDQQPGNYVEVTGRGPEHRNQPVRFFAPSTLHRPSKANTMLVAMAVKAGKSSIAVAWTRKTKLTAEGAT